MRSVQEHWNDVNHEFINFKVTKVTMQLRRSVIVVFSVDLECMWVSVCLSERSCSCPGIRACSVPALWISFQAAAAAVPGHPGDVVLVEGH